MENDTRPTAEETGGALRARLAELTHLHSEHEQAHAAGALAVAEGADGAAAAMNAAVQGMANVEAERKAVLAAIQELGKRAHREEAQRRSACLDDALQEVEVAAMALAGKRQAAIDAARAVKAAWEAMSQAQDALAQAHRRCGQEEYDEARRPHNNRTHQFRPAPKRPTFTDDVEALAGAEDVDSDHLAGSEIGTATRHVEFSRRMIRKELTRALASEDERAAMERRGATS